jgi:lysophospholipase L1-like esterase
MMNLLAPCLLLATACQNSKKETTAKAPLPPAPSAEQSQSPVEGPKSHDLAEGGGPELARNTSAQEPRRYVVAALGDSITDQRSGGGGYLKELRKACPGSEFLDFGKGGDMTNQMRRRWEQDILPQVGSLGLTTLLVYGGVNDLYSDLTAHRINTRIEEDLTKIYSGAHKAGLKVVAVTVSPWGGFTKYFNPRRGQNTLLLNAWILGQVADGLVDHAVDSHTPLSCGDPTKLCPDYEFPSKDGLHPAKEGHQILAKKLHTEVFSDCL